MHAKNQDRSPRKISRFFSAGFISVSRDFTPYFHFRCVARATFDRNLNHSADVCFLVMSCVAYSRVQLKTLSSLLKSNSFNSFTNYSPDRDWSISIWVRFQTLSKDRSNSDYPQVIWEYSTTEGKAYYVS